MWFHVTQKSPALVFEPELLFCSLCGRLLIALCARIEDFAGPHRVTCQLAPPG